MTKFRNMKFRLLYITIVAAIIPSCVQPLEIEPAWEESPLVVHCVLKRNINIAEQYTTQTVELCYASATGQDEFAKVQEAEVTVYDKDRKKAFTFTNEGNGVWTSEFTPDYDCTYSLEIKIPGRETITAETRVPENVTVFKNGFPRNYHAGNGGLVEGVPAEYAIELIEKAGLVPPEKEIGGCIIGCIVPEKPWSEFPVAESYTDNRTKHDIYVWIRHNLGCDLATDHIYADDCNATSRTYDAGLFNTEELSLDSKLKSYKGIVPYCYGLPLHKGFLRIVNPADYLRSAPDRYGRVDFKSSPNPDKDGYSGFKAVPDHEFDRAFVILGDFTYKTPKEYAELEIPEYLEARVVSKELDKYYRDVYSYMNTNNDNIFNMVYSSSESISSNIRNGLGIFGAEVTSKAKTMYYNVFFHRYPESYPDFYPESY